MAQVWYEQTSESCIDFTIMLVFLSVLLECVTLIEYSAAHFSVTELNCMLLIFIGCIFQKGVEYSRIVFLFYSRFYFISFYFISTVGTFGNYWQITGPV